MRNGLGARSARRFGGADGKGIAGLRRVPAFVRECSVGVSRRKV
jgi:hypothetical protein